MYKFGRESPVEFPCLNFRLSQQAQKSIFMRFRAFKINFGHQYSLKSVASAQTVGFSFHPENSWEETLNGEEYQKRLIRNPRNKIKTTFIDAAVCVSLRRINVFVYFIKRIFFSSELSYSDSGNVFYRVHQRFMGNVGITFLCFGALSFLKSSGGEGDWAGCHT